MGRLIISTLFLTISLLFINNPLLISYVVVLISCFIAVQLPLFANQWLAYIIILVFSGGMIILMIYVRSLASHPRPFFFRYKEIFFRIPPFLLLSTLSNLSDSEFPCDEIWIGHMFFGYDLIPLIWILYFLLAGIFLIVFLVNKSRGALR